MPSLPYAVQLHTLPPRTRVRRSLLRMLGPAAVLAALTWFIAGVFQITIEGVPSAGLGGWIDPYLINALLEHWYYSLTTLSDPLSPSMFFPARGTLGHSVGLVLFAPFYVLLRPFLDPFQALTVTLFLVIELGTVCLYLLGRRLGLTWVESFLIAALFVTSENVVNGALLWSQRASVFLLPPIGLLLHQAWCRRTTRAGALLGGAAGLLFALMLVQDFVTGAFAHLFVVVLAGPIALAARWPAQDDIGIPRRVRATAIAGLQTLVSDRIGRVLAAVAGVFVFGAFVTAVWPLDRTTIGTLTLSARDPTRPAFVALLAGIVLVARHVRPLVWIRVLLGSSRADADVAAFARSDAVRTPAGRLVVAFCRGWIAGVAMFLVIYLPPFLELGGFPGAELLLSVWQPDPSRWTSLSAVLDDLVRYPTSRPFLCAAIVAAIAWLPWRASDARLRWHLLWSVFVALLVLLMALRFGTWSPWRVLVGWIPGMTAIRDAPRIIYVYELAVCAIAMLWLVRAPARSARVLTAGALAALLFLSPWNATRLAYDRPAEDFMTYVTAPIDVDPRCRSFFTREPSAAYVARPGYVWTKHALDSFFVSMRVSIPTLNGYSAFFPPGWRAGDPLEREYRQHVSDWIALNRLEQVCELDLERRTMRLVDPAEADDATPAARKDRY